MKYIGIRKPCKKCGDMYLKKSKFNRVCSKCVKANEQNKFFLHKEVCWQTRKEMDNLLDKLKVKLSQSNNQT